MGHTDHHAKAGQRAAKVEVVIVSTSRHAGSDRSGPALVEGLKGAGHQVSGPSILPDDGGKIAAKVKELAAGGQAEVVILSGGTGLSRRDGTFEAVSALFTRVIPGFGELFRMLSFQEIGAAAMLSRATAGLVGELLVFVIPGSPAACELALKKLILPELSHLLWELGKEPAGDAVVASGGESTALQAAPEAEAEPAAEAPEGRGSARQILAEKPEEDDTPPVGWLKTPVDWGVALRFDLREELPEGLARLAPALDVLQSAGEQATLELNGERYTAFGFPDLRRATSKVLLVGQGAPYGEIIALHRQPKPVGAHRDGGGKLVSTGRLSRTSIEVTGQDYPGDGRLFATDAETLYVREGDTVWAWDGRQRRREGSVGSALASLLLRWSQR